VYVVSYLFTKAVVLENNLKLTIFDSLDNLDMIEGVYYQPKDKNFGAIDSFVRKGNDIYFFQVTVSETHEIKNSLLKNHIEVLKKITEEGKQLQFNLVFVVPPDIFRAFKKQPYHSVDNKVIKSEDLKLPVKAVEQYVLEVPLAVV